MAEISEGPMQRTHARAHFECLVALSCLAPDIVAAIRAGRHPPELTANKLSSIVLPIGWEKQRTKLHFGPRYDVAPSYARPFAESGPV